MLVISQSKRPISKLIPALELAFRQRADVIYIFSDGDFPNPRELLRDIRRLNRFGTVRINTVGFGLEDQEPIAARLLKEIAQEYGGSFSRIDQR